MSTDKKTLFPIRAGDHVVSEALAKALINRGYAAIWLERRTPMFGEDDHRAPGDFGAFAADLRNFVLDARSLIGWLATRPEVDPERIATAGVSLGGILAVNTLAQEPRAKAGFFVMAGGGLAEILRDSQDGDVVRFREQGIEPHVFMDGEDVVRLARPFTDPVDPLSWADRIDPGRVLMISARFDRVIAPARTHALWLALGRPRCLTVGGISPLENRHPPARYHAGAARVFGGLAQNAHLHARNFIPPARGLFRVEAHAAGERQHADTQGDDQH